MTTSLTTPATERPLQGRARAQVSDHSVSSAQPSFVAPEVQAVFDSYGDDLRQPLLDLRELIFETAAETTGVGPLEETLKWGQPSYLTTTTKSGSTVRVAPTGSKSRHDYAIFFICHTDLVERFRSLFGETFAYDGNRALLFTIGTEIPLNELRQCIAMALTYRLK